MVSDYEEGYGHLIDRDFPERLLKPWKERAAVEAPGWNAIMRPLGEADDADAEYALERWDTSADGVRRVVRLTGKSQDALIAHTLDIGWTA